MNNVVVIDRNAFKVLMMAVRSYLRVPNDERKQHLLMAWDRVDGLAAQPQENKGWAENSPASPVQQAKRKMCPVHGDSLEQDENGTYYCVNAMCTYPMFHVDKLL